MLRLGSAGAAVVNEETDKEVKRTDEVLVVESAVARGGLNKDRALLKLDAGAAKGEARRVQQPDGGMEPGVIGRVVYWRATNREKLVADADASIVTRAARSDVSGYDSRLSGGQLNADPGISVIMERIFA